MFDVLDRYRSHGHFFFTATDSLEDVCNVPDKRDGVYLVYQLKDGHVDLVYVGASGTRDILVVKDSLFGLKQTIINGIGSQNEPRSRAWAVKMLAEGIHALDIYWYVTYSGSLKITRKGYNRWCCFSMPRYMVSFRHGMIKLKVAEELSEKGVPDPLQLI